MLNPIFIAVEKVGRIYIADLNESPVNLVEVKISSKIDLMLNPHGSSLIEIDGRILLYVVNHKTDLSRDSVEKFEYFQENNELVWIKSFENPAGELRKQ